MGPILKKLTEQFAERVECIFHDMEAQLHEAQEKEKINNLYYFVKYRLPDKLCEQVEKEVTTYRADILKAVQQRTDGGRYRRLEEQLSAQFNKLVIEKNGLGPNNTFYQAFGAFGLVGGAIYVGSSLLPIKSTAFFTGQVIVSSVVGLYSGFKTYFKFEKQYRDEMCAATTEYLAQNNKKFTEWLGHLVEFCEEENDLCQL